jgi:hypothetical protein
LKLMMSLLLAMATSGCHLWYKPVPVANAIGEERVLLAGDSVNAYRGPRFEVYGPSAEAVYDGYEQMNRAYRAFDRFFGGPSKKLAVVLGRDSLPPLDSATVRAFRARDFAVVQYLRPRGMRSRMRYGAPDYGGILWPIAPTAARQLLAEFARLQPGAPAAASDSALLDLFPLWYRAAVMRLAGDGSSAVQDLDRVRDKRGSLVPLRDLFPLVRSSAADSLVDPSRDDDSDDMSRTMGAQAGMLARYLIEREGTSVIGRFGRGYVARRSLSDLMGEFRSTPKNVAELERRWLIWLDSRED